MPLVTKIVVRKGFMTVLFCITLLKGEVVIYYSGAIKEVYSLVDLAGVAPHSNPHTYHSAL